MQIIVFFNTAHRFIVQKLEIRAGTDEPSGLLNYNRVRLTFTVYYLVVFVVLITQEEENSKSLQCSLDSCTTVCDTSKLTLSVLTCISFASEELLNFAKRDLVMLQGPGGARRMLSLMSLQSSFLYQMRLLPSLIKHP